jgi:serine protease
MNGRICLSAFAAALIGFSIPAVAQQGAGGANAQNTSALQRYIVKFTDAARGRTAVVQQGGRIVLELPRHAAVAALLPERAVEALQSNPHVAYVEVDPERHPTSVSQTTPYGITMVQADDTAFTATPAAQRLVCVIDSGIYPGHEDFAGIPIGGTNGPNPDLPWDQDGCGHGTHVAGTIAAANNLFGVVGVAPQSVGLHIVRVFGDSCDWTYASTLVAALDACSDAHANVVNMSLGGNNPSRTERTAFAEAYAAGILPVAAAGNGGSPATSYPAGYASVVSVAAVDNTEALASFSQRNADVELAAPGVGVLSTTPWASNVNLEVGTATYAGSHMEGAVEGTVSGELVDGGLCTSAGQWGGKVVLCQRGSNYFRDKVRNVTRGGGVAAVIYNNVTGSFSGTLGNAPVSIMAISISKEDGETALASTGSSATVNDEIVKPGSSYEAWDGTSMATPHVAGVAALIWSYYPGRTVGDIRNALTSSAKDLGAAGRDNSFGFGLVQAKKALDALAP